MPEVKKLDPKGLALLGSIAVTIGSFMVFQDQIFSWLSGKFATKEFVVTKVKESQCAIEDVIATTRYADKYERLDTNILYLQDKLDTGVSTEADRRQLKRLESTMRTFENQWQRIADKAGKCNLSADDFSTE